MPDTRRYYVICEDNCKFESMTKEQIIAAIAEATGNVPTGVDDAFITKWKEGNAAGAVELWVGTEAQFNALSPSPAWSLFQLRRNTATGKWYAITDVRNDVIRVAETLDADAWSNASYSFETEYPAANYDITVEPADTATAAQYKAFAKALIAGNASTNVLKAVGTVPTVDIPVIITARTK